MKDLLFYVPRHRLENTICLQDVMYKDLEVANHGSQVEYNYSTDNLLWHMLQILY